MKLKKLFKILLADEFVYIQEQNKTLIKGCVGVLDTVLLKDIQNRKVLSVKVNKSTACLLIRIADEYNNI